MADLKLATITSTTTIDAVPQEIMIEIFKYLSNRETRKESNREIHTDTLKDILSTCQVSKLWYELSWTYRPEIDISFHVEDENARIFITRSPSLHNLLFKDCYALTTPMYIEIFEKQRNLKRLDLCFCKNLTDEVLQQLWKLPQLRYLFLSDAKITNEGLKCIAQMKNLHTLGLVSMQDLTDEGVKNLQPLVGQLEGLNLAYSSKLTDECITIISAMSKLVDLKMKQCDRLTDKGLLSLAVLTKLQRLDLIGSNFTDAAKEYVVKALVNLKKAEFRKP